MTARLLDGGDDGVCGVLTSGGTESIVLAAKAHRDFYREVCGCSRLLGFYRSWSGVVPVFRAVVMLFVSCHLRLRVRLRVLRTCSFLRRFILPQHSTVYVGCLRRGLVSCLVDSVCPSHLQRGVTSPEIVVATTAHAAIDKACSLMDIRLIKVSTVSFCVCGGGLA